MFCLIWLFGGGGRGETGDADVAECGGLEDEERPERDEETGDDETLEEEWLWELVSFG